MQCALCVLRYDYRSLGKKGEKSVFLFMHENILHVITTCIIYAIIVTALHTKWHDVFTQEYNTFKKATPTRFSLDFPYASIIHAESLGWGRCNHRI